MPTSDATAFRLLSAIGMLEFALKRTPGFLGAEGSPVGRRAKAKVDWQAVDRAAASIPAAEFRDRLSHKTLDRLLGAARDRPKVQFVHIAADGSWIPKYESSPLPSNDAEAIIVAMRRVRNNLFHGGKEDPLEEPSPGDDEEWAKAATEVAALLLDLLERGILRR